MRDVHRARLCVLRPGQVFGWPTVLDKAIVRRASRKDALRQAARRYREDVRVAS